MLLFVHILTGAVIAKYFPNLIPIIILSIIFHFIIDIIPHKDTPSEEKLTKKNYNIKITKKAVLFEFFNIILSLSLILYIFYKFNNRLMLFGIFVSIFPDIIKVGYLTKLKYNKIFKEYLSFHSIIQTDTGWKIGILTQSIVTLILLWLLF